RFRDWPGEGRGSSSNPPRSCIRKRGSSRRAGAELRPFLLRADSRWGGRLMDIAITGATGFLGRYLVRQLAPAGHPLRCSCRPASDRSGFEPWAGAIDWLPGSLGDESATGALVQGADAVVHAALERPERGSFLASGRGDLEGFLQANLMGSLRLF